MVEEVAKNIYRIGVPLPGNPLKELNSYFIRGSENDVLIDTGFRCQECGNALRDGLRELGSDPRRRDVLITHIHSDHSGMADLFVGPGRKIYMSEADMAYERSVLYGDFDDRRMKRFLSEGFAEEMIREVFSSNPANQMALPGLTDAFCALRDEAVISVGEYDLKVIMTPGHTPGNVMFWAEKQGIMFSGDHILFDITPNITEWPGMDDALGSYLESLKRVRAYPVKLALPGHRKTGEYHERIDQLLRHHERRIAEVKDIIGTSAGKTAYEIAGQMKWHIRAENWEKFPIIQKWFAVGECLSHLDYLRKRGGIIREMENGIWRYYVA